MNAQTVKWDNLQYFLALARRGTLVGAGKALGVNHSTVYRRITALEEELHTRLFDRGPQGYELTASGNELLSHVLAMEEEVLAMGRKIAGQDQRLRGPVRVATVDDLATTLLMPIIGEFRAAHPGVVIVLDIHPEFADLSRLEADIAIRFGARPTNPQVVARRVATVASFIYASKYYLKEEGLPEHPEHLSSHRIVRGSQAMAGLAMEMFIDRYAGQANVALRTDSMLARLAALRQGIGLGFLPHFMAHEEPLLERLELTAPEETNIWMVLHADLRKSARIRAFADFAYERLVEKRHLFDPR